MMLLISMLFAMTTPNDIHFIDADYMTIKEHEETEDEDNDSADDIDDENQEGIITLSYEPDHMAGKIMNISHDADRPAKKEKAVKKKGKKCKKAPKDKDGDIPVTKACLKDIENDYTESRFAQLAYAISADHENTVINTSSGADSE